MGLADEIREAHPVDHPGPSCSAGVAIAQHDEREELARLVAIADEGHPEYVAGSQIAQYLASTEGWGGSAKTVNRHRRGVNGDSTRGCRCRQ